jgi:flagellar biosynthesis anti-sigma factor FlgM
MSINALGVVTTNSLQEIDKASVASAAASTKGPTVHQQATTEDTTSFTSDKQTVQSLSRTAIQTIPSRQAKVEALKQAVNSAQYQLDSDKIAASLANAEV